MDIAGVVTTYFSCKNLCIFILDIARLHKSAIFSLSKSLPHLQCPSNKLKIFLTFFSEIRRLSHTEELSTYSRLQ